MKKILLLLCWLPVTLLVTGCGSDNSIGDPCENSFDQAALFAHLADEQIIPAYTHFQENLSALQVAVQAFTNSPSTLTLGNAQSALRPAWLAWQRIAQYEFGPAEEVALRSSLNNFPANITAIESNIAAGTTDFNRPDTYDKGFPALDYLLFGTGDTPAAIVERFNAGELAPANRQYLTRILDDMTTRTSQVVDAWQNQGYRDAFVRNTGTAAGTSLSLLINSLNEHYEAIRRDKLGIPSGALTLGFTNPDQVEARYSGLSRELCLEAVRAARALFAGETSTGINGNSLDDLLNYIDAQKDGQPLSALIINQFTAAITAIEAISQPLHLAVEQQKSVVSNAYVAMQRQVILLKTDMPSMLCVAITYVDNPSDSD